MTHEAWFAEYSLAIAEGRACQCGHELKSHRKGYSFGRCRRCLCADYTPDTASTPAKATA